MQRINVQYFYQLASNLIPLKGLQEGRTILDTYLVFYEASRELEFFLQNPLLPPLTSYSAGNELLTMLKPIMEDFLRADPLKGHEVAGIAAALGRFEVVLQAEFARRDTFTVSRKGIYSTTDLVEYGQNMVSFEALKLFPEAEKDLHDAGRCIAFDLPTSAAFHLFRAVEASVQGYIFQIRQKPVTATERKFGLGGYANLLKEKSLSVDERIHNSIAQLAKLHRNPGIHPDQHLSSVEVIATQGMVVSVIEVMTLDVLRRKNTPEVPLSAVLPDDSAVGALKSVEDVKELAGGGAVDDGQGTIGSDDAKDSKRLEAGAETKTRRKRRVKDGKEALY